MKMSKTLLLIILFSAVVSAQRGCPSEGCDPRGLNCQADFQVEGTEATIAWSIDLGPNSTVDDQKSLGCVGNDANVICKVGNKHSLGFVSVDAKVGKINWYDTLMKNPRLPIMDIQGNIIATDGHYLEMRLKNGSLVGHASAFYGYINDTSSIHYVMDPNVFFFVSYESGGMYMYDTSGMCVASHFFFVKDPITNQTVSTWIPVSRLVVNTEVDPPCTYFLAQNNVTKKYEIFAVNFNHEPPYLSLKWSLAVDVDHSTDPSDITGSRFIVRGSTLFFALPSSKNTTLIIQDKGTDGSLFTTLSMTTLSMASFDLPVNSGRQSVANEPIIWLNTISGEGQTILCGWTKDILAYSINLSHLFNTSMTALTSELMVFGYHEENITLVFAYTAIGKSEQGDLKFTNHLTAIKPLADGKARVLWNLPFDSYQEIIGQLIGVEENMLLATLFDGQTGSFHLIGIQLH